MSKPSRDDVALQSASHGALTAVDVLEQTAQRRIWLLETLHLANALIADSDDIELALQNVATELGSRFHFTTVAIGLVEGDEIVYHGLAAQEALQRLRIPLTAGVSGRVIRTGTGEFVRDVSVDPDFIGIGTPVVREIAVPIIVDGVAYGVLNVEADDETSLGNEEFDVMRTVARSLGVAIERSRQRARERRRLQHLSALQHLTGRIAGRERVDENAADLAHEIASLFDFDFVSLGFVNNDQLHFHASFDEFSADSSPVDIVPAAAGITGRVLRTGEPAFITDVTQDADYVGVWPAITQEICVPIYVAGRVFGVLNVEVSSRRTVDAGDFDIVKSLGDHLGLVIANQRRIDELEQRNAQLRTVERVTAVIAGKLLVREALPDILIELERGFGFGSTGIGLIHGDLLVFHAIRELVENPSVTRRYTTQGIPLGTGVTGRVALSGVPAFVPDVHRDPDYLPTSPGIQHEICVPIRVDERTVGVLNVETSERRPLNEHDVEILSVIADHIGIAMQKSDLYAAEQQSRQAIEALQRVSTIVASTLDVDEALQLIVRTLADVFGYPLVSMWLRDGSMLVLAAHADRIPQGGDRSFRIGEGVIGRVATTGRAEFIADVTAEPAYVASGHGTSSEVCVPIYCNGELAGVLNIEGDQERPVTSQDLELMKTFAQHAGSVLQNARMYESMEHLATRDPVTGMPNHREFQIRLREELARATRRKQSLSMLLIDLDSFKQVNDNHGHVIGDELLHAVARRLGGGLRDGDVLARYGGDEFVAILPEAEAADASMIGTRLSALLTSTPFRVSNGCTVYLSVSIGTATFPQDGSTAVDLIKHADTAMYEVKRQSGSQPR